MFSLPGMLENEVGLLLPLFLLDVLGFRGSSGSSLGGLCAVPDSGVAQLSHHAVNERAQLGLLIPLVRRHPKICPEGLMSARERCG